MSTVTVIAIFGCLYALQIACWTLCVRVGARTVLRERVPWMHLTGMGILYFSIVSVGLMAQYVTLSTPAPWPTVALAFALLSETLIPIAIIAWQLRCRWSKGLLVWLFTLAGSGLQLVLVAGLVRPYFVEAFTIPTNAMAPTLLGTHQVATCPECGAPAYGSILPQGFPSQTPLDIICEQRHHAQIARPRAPQAVPGDRILVTKHRTPGRWDLIVFRAPSDPSINYVKRLVGLPGETLQLHEGAVWINGEKLTPPPELSGLRYAETMEGQSVWGTEPVLLGSDEYFVLGDFTQRSFDSRMWTQGSANRPPYAVPRDHLIGVVTHCYWPVHRVRVLRP